MPEEARKLAESTDADTMTRCFRYAVQGTMARCFRYAVQGIMEQMTAGDTLATPEPEWIIAMLK